MQAPALAGAVKTPGILVLVGAGILGIFMYLVPSGSFPVGFDVWWNLHVVRTWAESGFPDVLPEAGFTQFARAYADRQIGFHAVLALLFGSSIDESVVPPLIWAFVVAQVAVVFGGLRLLRKDASAAWLVLLPALSATWLFRLTALRDMLAGVLPLLLLVCFLAAPRRRRNTWLAGLMALLFGYLHGATVLPLVLAVLVTLGWRLAGDGWRWRPVAAVFLGLLPSLFLRPDFPHNLELAWTLNVRMPLASVLGDLPIQPSEFRAPSLSWLWTANAPYLFALAAFVYGVVRGRVAWPLGLPVLVLGVGAILGSRLFELAVPLLVIALGSARWRPAPWLLGLLAIAASLLSLERQVPAAAASVEANRFEALRDCGQWLRTGGHSEETIFVTDWAVTSPLAWWTRGLRLRFTGVTDPSLMWAEDRAAFDAWWRVKSAQDPDPVSTMAEVFGARSTLVLNSDCAPGRPVGETAAYLYEALRKAEESGWAVGHWDFGPPNARGFKYYRFQR